MSIRNSAKAIVLHEGKILVNRCSSRFGEYYALPGGGQRTGEMLQETVKRELLEETPIDKPAFGSVELMKQLQQLDAENRLEAITFVGLCTDICVISNAIMAKAALPEVPVIVDAACCAGVTPESHKTALAAMRMCQIIIENENE